jgi:hypothetical protein
LLPRFLLTKNPTMFGSSDSGFINVRAIYDSVKYKPAIEQK